MKSMQTAWLTIGCLAASFSTTNCATTPIDPELDVENVEGVSDAERLERARIVHATLLKDAGAERLTVELARVGTWLNQCETMLAEGRQDERIFGLLLTASESQLANVRMSMGRIAAETAFNNRRQQYVDDMNVLTPAQNTAQTGGQP
jgi:hypothetical protein